MTQRNSGSSVVSNREIRSTSSSSQNTTTVSQELLEEYLLQPPQSVQIEQVPHRAC